LIAPASALKYARNLGPAAAPVKRERRASMRILFSSLLIASLAIAPVAARRPRPPGSSGSIPRLLFVAPSGKPYRGQPGDPYPVAAWFAEADADHDGKVSRAEFRANFMAYFDVLDTNHDGEIDPDEIDHYESAILPEVHMNPVTFGGYSTDPSADDSNGDASSGPSQVPDEHPGGAALFGFFATPEPLLAMDTNFNRGISRSEYASAADRAFRALDPQNHGYLTLDALPRTWAQR
jgi:hypothetical protein